MSGLLRDNFESRSSNVNRLAIIVKLHVPSASNRGPLPSISSRLEIFGNARVLRGQKERGGFAGTVVERGQTVSHRPRLHALFLSSAVETRREMADNSTRGTTYTCFLLGRAIHAVSTQRAAFLEKGLSTREYLVVQDRVNNGENCLEVEKGHLLLDE